MSRVARQAGVAAPAGARAWWRQSGPDACPFCLRTYYPEVAGYCVYCDRPTCPVCAVYLPEGRIRLCPECAEGGE